MQAMCCDYGFRSGVGRLYQGSTGEVPKNFFALVRSFVLGVAFSPLLDGALQPLGALRLVGILWPNYAALLVVAPWLIGALSRATGVLCPRASISHSAILCPMTRWCTVANWCPKASWGPLAKLCRIAGCCSMAKWFSWAN